MSVRDEVRQLLDPEAGLLCLPRFMKRWLWSVVKERPDESLRQYRSECLGIVERYIEPVGAPPSEGGHPQFHTLCRDLATADDFGNVAKRLGVATPYVFDTKLWLSWARRRRSNEAVRLYCIANCWPVPVGSNDWREESTRLCLFHSGRSLKTLGRSVFAAALIEEWLEFDATLYDAPRRLTQALSDPSSKFASLTHLTFQLGVLTVLADALCQVPGRGPRHAMLLLELWLGLQAEWYNQPGRLAEALTNDKSKLVTIGVLPDQAITVLRVLASALRCVPGRGRGHAATLLESWVVRPMSEFAAAERLLEVHPATKLRFVDAWLQAAEPGHPDALATVKAVVQFVAGTRELTGDAILPELQRVVLFNADGDRNAGQTDAANDLDLFLVALTEEFENRSHAERLRSYLQRGGLQGTTLPAAWQPHQWAWNQSWLPNQIATNWYDDFRNRRITGSAAGDRLRPDAGVAGLLGVAAPLECRPAATLGTKTDAEPSAPGRPEGRPEQDGGGPAGGSRFRMTAPERRTPAYRTRAVTIAGQLAESRPDLTGLIPPGAVFLQTLFGPDGTLYWWALGGPGERLTVLKSGRSEPGAEAALRAADLRFSLGVERIWFLLASHGKPAVLSDEERLVLAMLAEFAGDREYAELRLRDPEEYRLRSQELRAAIGKLLEPQAAARGRPLRALAQLGQNLFDHVFNPRPDDGSVADEILEAWLAELNSVRELRQEFDGDQKDPEQVPRIEGARRAEQKRLTDQYVDTLGRHLNLDPLWEETKGEIDWSETDLVYQLHGPLWGAPISLVSFGGAPLFTRVASTTAVVSLALRRAAEQLGETVRTPQRRILSAHWIAPQERERMEGLAYLHSGLQQVGKSHGWEVWGLGDLPLASVVHVRGAVGREDQPFGVVVIGGHGEPAAVRLADGAWQGDGAELLHSDVVILVVCVAGRLWQRGNKDVEGLYTQMLAHGCRNLIAARWPIPDTEAAFFATEVVNQYLSALGPHGRPGPFACARALNRARRRLLDPTYAEFIPGSGVTAHLAAAFEIYGAG